MIKNIFKIVISILAVIFLLQSKSTAQWKQMNGLSNDRVTYIAVMHDEFGDTNIFAGTDGGGVYRSTDYGTSWTQVNSGLTNTRIWSLAISSTNLFAGTDGGLYISANNGTSWTETGLTNTGVWSLAFSPISDGSGINLFAGTYGGVFLSTNNGTSWTGDNSGLNYDWILSLAVTPASDGSGTNLFAGTWGDGLFLSTNDGTSWIQVDSGLTSKYVLSLIVDPTGGGTSGTNLFAGTNGGGVFLSTDNGISWEEVNTGLTDKHVNSFAVSATFDGTKLFAGTWAGGGVFLSTNNGASWTQVNSGLTNMSVRSLAVSGTKLFAGTDGGIWMRPLSEMVTAVENVKAGIPKEFSLKQNYPNPFNPSTTIEYSIPKSGSVSIKVCDILGREVATLVDANKPAGIYRVTWNASGMSSGVYFYRSQAGKFSETKKLVLLR